MQWDFIGSLGMLEYEEMRLPMSSQGVAPVGLSWHLESLDETYNTSSIAGWSNSTGQDGEVLAIPRAGLGINRWT
jgi:hypothetical protein